MRAVAQGRGLYASVVRASVVIATLLVGCSGALTVRGEVVRPARVPVRAFPRILVTATDDAESREIADNVAAHLTRGRSDVERVGRERIATLRTGGAIPRGAVVLEVRARLIESDRPGWGNRDELECGPTGCVESRRLELRDVPVLEGLLLVSVTDGPSARPLQRVELREEESGADVFGMRLRVLDRLGQAARALLDQRTEHVNVELLPIDRPEVARALDAVRSGDWRAARRALARFVRSDRFGALPADQRARVLYDLGQTLRFDPTLPAEARFDHAERALERAVRLAPEPRYARALADLESHRRSRAMVIEQAEAMAHNFELYHRQGSPD